MFFQSPRLQSALCLPLPFLTPAMQASYPRDSECITVISTGGEGGALALAARGLGLLPILLVACGFLPSLSFEMPKSRQLRRLGIHKKGLCVPHHVKSQSLVILISSCLVSQIFTQYKNREKTDC